MMKRYKSLKALSKGTFIWRLLVYLNHSVPVCKRLSLKNVTNVFRAKVCCIVFMCYYLLIIIMMHNWLAVKSITCMLWKYTVYDCYRLMYSYLCNCWLRLCLHLTLPIVIDATAVQHLIANTFSAAVHMTARNISYSRLSYHEPA